MKQEDTEAMSSYPLPVQAQTPRTEGVAVVGEAVRRMAPEAAEFLIEITAGAPNAAQAMREIHLKTSQIAQAVAALGVQQADLQTVSLNVANQYAPLAALPGFAGPGFAGAPQIGHPGFQSYPANAPNQTEVQFGSYHARNLVRVNVREPGRLGEIVDTAARAGAIIVGGFAFKASDEATARRTALEAAARDARAKAETLAAATGRQLGEPIAICEDMIASNGTYAALRSAMPFAFGPAAPGVAGELEYYARVSASFRLQ